MTRPPKPPRAERRPVVREHFGVRLEDPFAWMRDPAWPEVRDLRVLAQVKAENAYWGALTAHLRGLEERLFIELRGRIEEEDESVPVREGAFEYRWRYPAGAQYRVWERRPASGGGFVPILDENRLAEGRVYFDLRTLRPSPDGRLLAYAVDLDGSERYVVKVRDLACGEDLPFEIANTGGSVVWAEDGRTLVTVELDPRLRPHRVLATRVDARGSPRVLYEEPDPAFFVGIGKTRSRRFLVVGSGTHVTREVRLFDAHTLEGGAPVVPRREGHDYRVDHARGRLFVLTNDCHRNFRLVAAPEEDPRESRWEELIPPSESVYLLDFACFRDFLVVAERVGGIDRIRVFEDYGEPHTVDFGEEIYAATIGDNREFDQPFVRLAWSSPITPHTVVDWHVRERRGLVRKVQRIPSGYEPERYATRRLWAVSRDGREVPITLVGRREVLEKGLAPLLLYGYGAYGHGLQPVFSPHRLGLLDRGMLYAMAHVRGGDELGYGWYEEGKLFRRWNTFHDFLACAQELVHTGITEHGRIVAQGGSAGGTLVGVAVNERPDLFAAAVLQVPFVDVLNTMMDQELPLTPIEWSEWGDPLRDVRAFRYILSYSPYENVRPQRYPPLFVTAGLHDPRVTYWEPMKYVARLREVAAGGPFLLRIETGAGHFGPSGRFEHLREIARVQAFVIDVCRLPHGPLAG